MISGIYNQISEIADIGELIDADGVTARFNVPTASVQGAQLLDAVAVRGSSYRIVGIEPTGRGRTVLVLGV